MSIWKYLGLVIVFLYVVGFLLSLGSKFMKKHAPPKVQPPPNAVIIPPRHDGEN